MDLIEALEKTKIKYPDLKTVEDFQDLLNKVSYRAEPIFKEAKDKLEAYLGINKETDDFDKFIEWVRTRIKMPSDEYKKHGGHSGMRGSSYSERYVKKYNKENPYPSNCRICKEPLPKSFVTNCPSCQQPTRS